MHHLHFDLTDGSRITVVADQQFDPDSADNVTKYETVHCIPSRVARCYFANRALTLTRADGSSVSCLLRFPNGTPLSQTNTLVHRNRLLIASGVAIAAVNTRGLNIEWTCDLQTGADNGLHIFGSDWILAIGDFDATMLNWDGTQRWFTNIPGCLFAPGTITDNTLSISDDDYQTHLVDLPTGKVLTG